MTEIEEAAAFISMEMNKHLQKFVGEKLTEPRILAIQHHASVALFEITQKMLGADAEDVFVEDIKVTADGDILHIEVTGETLDRLKELLRRVM